MRDQSPLLWTLLLIFLFVGPHALAQPDLLGGLQDPYPLRAADTSSPRDTLRSFTRDFNQAVDAWRNDRSRADVLRPLLRAAETFDFTELPVVVREAAIISDMALLKEVLDRVEWPEYEQIPGDEEVTTEGITRWVVPNTKIEIVKIEDGPKSGQFLFSKSTVKQIRNYYDLVKGLPYKTGALVGIYDEFRMSPGPWLSQRFPNTLPRWGTHLVGGQAVWQWVALALLIGLSAVVTGFVYFLGATWDDRQEDEHPRLRFGVPVALLAAVVIAGTIEAVARDAIGLLELPLDLVSYAVLAAQVVCLSWFAVVVSGRLADALSQERDEPNSRQRFTPAFMRVLFRLVSVIFLVLLATAAAEAVGIPIAPLVASLGVGGLALALAIRPTLENVIGGLTLFADRPVRVGEFCRYGDQIGTVEQIGLRSTRIRSLERSLITIPNAEFSQMQLDNFSSRDMRLLQTVLQLRYETTPEQMRYVLAGLRRMLLGHPMVAPEPARARLVGYGAYSKNVEVFAYVRTSDHNTFLAIQEDVLLRMEDIVIESGSGFAFPSQTMYYTRDQGLSAERGREAEAKVQEWRALNQLPFPEFDPALRWEMEDILDYPQRGAYNSTCRAGLSDLAPPISPPQDASPDAPGNPVRRWFGFFRGSRKQTP
jgi:MscS family membrane protein